jgi:hypothetical protein
MRIGLMSFVYNKTPEDGILVPKHVGVGASYVVFFNLFCSILIGAFFG